MKRLVRSTLASLARRLSPYLEEIEASRIENRNRSVLQSAKSVGANVRLNGPMTISGASSLVIGDNVDINENAWIRAEGGLTIGSHTKVSRNLVLYTVNHNSNGERLPYNEENVARPVSIGECVWIGMNVCIAPGSTIGDGSIIGMGTVVSGEIPPMSIVVGAKARVIGQRDQVKYEQLYQAESFAGMRGFPMAPDDRSTLGKVD